MFSQWISRLVLLAITGASAALLAGFFGWLHPAFDTLAHFRLHLSSGLLFCAAVLLVLSRPAKMFVCLLAGLGGLTFAVSGTRISDSTHLALPDRPVHTLFHLNLQYDHPNPEMVVQRIVDISPDIITLAETFNVWEPVLERLEARWPHFGKCRVLEGQSGVMIFSVFPLDTSEDYCGFYGSFLKTRVLVGGSQSIAVGSVHTRWPWPASGPVQYDLFQPELEKLEADALIAGDFNATPWSYYVTRFAGTGGLEIIGGIGPTWLFSELPAWMIRWAGLPIDHIMTKGRVRVLSARALDPVGSDHLPLLVEFQLE